MNFNLEIISKYFKIISIIVVLLLMVKGLYHGVDILFQNSLSFQARAVLSNFIVFSTVILFVMLKVAKTPQIFEIEQQTIKNNIQESENARIESEIKLSNIELTMANIETEIDSIMQKSEENSKLVGSKVLADAETSVQILKENTLKAISNSQTVMRNDLIKRIALASVEVAKNQIKQELENNSELHDKLIDESVNSIELLNNEDKEIA